MASLDQPNQQTHNHSPNHTIDVANPVTGEVIGTVPITTGDQLADMVERAQFAQTTWAALTVNERCRFVRRWLDLLHEQQAEGIALLQRENGKAFSSAYSEFVMVDSVGQYYIHHAANILKPERRTTLIPVVQWARVYHKPHGVVGIISPWNYPLSLAFADALAALVAGNTVVLKPSEITPLIAEWAVNLMYQAGFPRDVIQVAQGDGSTGAALINLVDYIQFTGSTATGKKVAQAALERLIPYSLELGGKDPAIVLNDADPDMTAVSLIQGAFENSGQVCVSVERVYVEAGIYDQLLSRIHHYMQQLTQGDPRNRENIIGSMTNRAELERVQAHLDDAVQKGARIIIGGNARPDLGALFFEPTILVDVDHSMEIMREETFGPVMPIMKVHNQREALRLANETPYGLSASLFTKNFEASEALALQIDSGDVSINRPQFLTLGNASLPTGGQKQSGTGRRNGREGLLKYTATQSIVTDSLIGAEKSVTIATPFLMRILATLRRVRRYLPFI